MKSPYYWLAKYREYTYSKQNFGKPTKFKADYVEDNIYSSRYGYTGDIEILERRIYQTLIYRCKLVSNYPYDYTEMLRFDDLLEDADINFNILLNLYSKEAKKIGIKFNKFKRIISKLAQSENERDYILKTVGVDIQ